jgi:hypothetical protein
MATAAAFVGWGLAPEPVPETALVKARRDDWNLAALPRRFEQTALAGTVLSAGFWGTSAAEAAAAAAVAAAVAAAPEPDRRWRVAAIYGRAQSAGVLITFVAPDRPPQRLVVGDALPSGHKIVSIGERELCVRIGKKTFRLGVERREN